MSRVQLCVHGGRAEAVDVAAVLTTWLVDRGHEVVPEAAAGGPSVDLVVAVGGDGTVLRGAAAAVAGGADVLGINLGELGYLAEVEPDGWRPALEAYFAGDHRIDERMLVACTAGERRALPPGLNEVVIEKREVGRTVRLGVAIDGEYFTSYVADGLIVATPTGSTAYSLSARGPIVAPTHRALLMTPVSPHSLFDRSLVLEPTSVVEITVLGDRGATVSIDGTPQAEVGVGEAVTITAAAEPARFVTFGGRDFHQILKAKFGLSDR